VVEALARTAPDESAAARRPRLLLIDDEPLVGRFIAHGAEECGYEAIVTISAESFRSRYAAAVPDVVVVDLALPGCDGVELLRFLADHGCRARVLIVSGFDPRVLESALRLGEAMGLDMAGPLTKPVRLQALAEALGPARAKAAP
jgi:DNA-binding response OmpR family regulator